MTNNEEQPQEQEVRKTFIQVFVEEVSASPLTITVLAILSALILGGLLVALLKSREFSAKVKQLKTLKKTSRMLIKRCLKVILWSHFPIPGIVSLWR